MEAKALIYCDGAFEQFEKFQHVWSLGTLAYLKLQSQNIPSVNIYGIELDDIDAKLRSEIENGLAMEANCSHSYPYIQLAYQHIHWRFIRYYQFKQRIETLVRKYKVSEIFVETNQDSDLIQACRSLEEKYALGVTFGNETQPLQSSMLSFLATYDIPKKVSLTSRIYSLLNALILRLRRIKTLCEPYHNLLEMASSSATFTWNRTIIFPGLSLFQKKMSKLASLVNLQSTYRSDHGLPLHAQFWPAFDSADLEILASAYSYFREQYSDRHLRNLQASLYRFLKISGVKFILLNSDNNTTTLLISRVAKSAGVKTAYLPHGLIWEDFSLRQQHDLGNEVILAWNDQSEKEFLQRGYRAMQVRHPSNSGSVKQKRRWGNDLSRIKVLIMPPEWVGQSFVNRPDCFEHDLLEIFSALAQCSIYSADIKCHNSIGPVVSAKMAVLERLREYTTLRLNILDSSLKSSELYSSYDLVILGPTTGILEVSRTSTPFICYRSFFQKAALLTKSRFPSANSPDELMLLMQNMDTQLLDDSCQRMHASLNIGPPLKQIVQELSQ